MVSRPRWNLRWVLWGCAASLAVPWLLRAYAAWWNLAMGRPGAFCDTFVPRVLP